MLACEMTSRIPDRWVASTGGGFLTLRRKPTFVLSLLRFPRGGFPPSKMIIPASGERAGRKGFPGASGDFVLLVDGWMDAHDAGSMDLLVAIRWRDDRIHTSG